MRRIREIESGFVRALSYFGAFLLISVFVAIPLIFLNSNLLWGEANQYGRVPIPGHKVVHLPAGSVEVSVWFGREPNPLHGWQVILAAMAIALVGELIWALISALRRRRRGPPDDGNPIDLTVDRERLTA